jgi:putative two-component system response regulator
MVKMPDKSFDQRKRVLFVDDDESLLRLEQIRLERAGYDFVGATNGSEGLSFAQAMHPDLILLDYMMPGLSGKEVFLEIIQSCDEQLRHTPVIMLTAKTDNYKEQRALLELGLSAYLCKPFGHHELLNVIDNVLVMTRIKERNRILEREARQSWVGTVKALISLLAVKDDYTGEHSSVVAEMAEMLARALNLSEVEITNVKLGALLHDVGKIGVPESVLRKTGSLTPDETDQMRLHVNHGERALEGVPHMEDVHAVVKHHHEWWNGNGYPFGLKEEEIPLGARIVAIVDAYDAMTSDRPYRQRLPQATAIQRLRAAAGVQFDHSLVEKFVECLESSDAERTRSINYSFVEELHYVA